MNARSDALRDFLTQYIKTETGGREDLIARLVPDYAPFSRRPVVDNGWYRALTRDNVELVTDDIARFTPRASELAILRRHPVDRTSAQIDQVAIQIAKRFQEVRVLQFWECRHKSLPDRAIESGVRLIKEPPRRRRRLTHEQHPHTRRLISPCPREIPPPARQNAGVRDDAVYELRSSN